MEVQRATSPGGSSATSTASHSRQVQMHNKAPKKPDCSDRRTWQSFLAAYQKGNWERTEENSYARCPKMARKVQVEGGAVIDNMDFFTRFKYLAAPPAPKEKLKARREALLRHGFNGPQTRSSVNRYVRHAKSVFKCDFVSVSLASSDNSRTLIVGSEGDQCSRTIAADTALCGHALLLDEDEVFVVPDLEKDWRFKHLLAEGKASCGMRFYASAPILLSSQLDLEGEDVNVPVHVGRLTIMGKHPRMEFKVEDAELLLDIARMTQEALENEYLQAYSIKAQSMQKNTAKLAYELNQVIDSDVGAHDPQRGEDNRRVALFCQDVMQIPVDLVRESVGATSVTAIDATSLHLTAPRPSTFSSSSSPRSSVSYGFTSPASVPWLPKQSVNVDPDIVSTASDPTSPSVARRPLPTFDESDERSTHSRTPSEISSPIQERRAARIQHSSTSSTLSTFFDDDLQNEEQLSPLRIIATSGDSSCVPDVSGTSQIVGACQFFRALKRKGLFTKPQMYNIQRNSDSDSDDEQQEDKKYEAWRVPNTLDGLLPSQTKLCVAVPVFSNDRSQALFLILIVWDYSKSLAIAEKLFCNSVGHILGAAAFRAQASIADRAQLDFIRSVQHELRTPLNAVLGITDLLRQSFVNDDEHVKLDMTQDGVLANLLESIRLSGVTLSTILDDVLDFGSVTGVRSKAATRIEEVDLEREVEDVCLDELEHISLTERQEHNMRIGSTRGYSAVPSLIFRVSPDVQSRFRTDRAKLRKILSKFIRNALHYCDANGVVEVTVQASERGARRDGAPNPISDRWIDFIIKDTGIGMSREFLANSFLKPFSKADSFSQGVGLGATIASNLISQLGGGFDVQSELEKGTRVRVSLPFGVSAPLLRRDGASQRRTSQFAPVRPYQIRTAAFHGFDSVGSEAVQALMTERLIKHDVEIVQPHQQPELMILQESTLFAPSEDQNAFTTAVETPYDMIPHPSGAKARTLVVTRTAMRTRTPSALDGQKVWFLRPPFGRSSLELMDEFLQEESPIVLRRIPSPTRTAKDNMNKVRENRGLKTQITSTPATGQASGKVSNIKDDIPSSAAAHALSSSVDESESVANSVATGSTAATSAPPVSSPPSHSAATHDALDSEGAKLQTHVTSLSAPLRQQTLVPESTMSGAPSTNTGEPFRVLVVEDNPVNMRLITVLLKREKYNYEEAVDGVQAVEKYKSYKPSVVLLDISLPLMDGFGACLQMRAHTLRHTSKIIAITALSSNEDKVRGLEECGMDDWRTKPLSIKTLRVDMAAWKRDWEDAWGVEGEPFAGPQPSAVFPATSLLNDAQTASAV